MIEFTAIETLILAYAPGLITIIGIITAFCKLAKIINQIRLDNKISNAEKNAELKSLKDDLKIVIQENYELKKRLNECMSKIDHVRRD